MRPTADASRRLRPRIIDSDWLVLRGMAESFDRAIETHVRNGTCVIDFGCGTMPYRSLVMSRGGHYLGADFGDGADVAILPDGHVVRDDASVDVVLSIQVLEHVRDLDTYFNEIARILKPGGVLLLSTHGTWLYHPHPEDHRRWTRPGLANEIESRGWKVTSCESIVGPLAWTTLVRLTGYCHALRNVPLVGSLAGAAVAACMNVRARLEDGITPSHIRNDNACVYLMSAVRAEAQ
jgi:SAM-dependent methyltransferase